MTQFVSNNVSSGAIVYASDHNTQGSRIAAVVNGGIDDNNISASAAIAGSKLADTSVTGGKVAADTLDLEAKSSVDTGWRHITDSWTYASATTITVPSDATTKYSVGDKIKLVQTTTKYFYITGVASTVLTINGGTDYTLVNAAISSIYYSKVTTPLGFPGEFNYLPTLSNVTTGNGTITGKFTMIGKVVEWYAGILFGSTTAHTVGQVSISLPVTSATYTNYSTVIGQGAILSSGAYPVFASWLTNTTVELDVTNTAGTYAVGAGVTSTVPTSLGSGHAGASWYISGTYKAA